MRQSHAAAMTTTSEVIAACTAFHLQRAVATGPANLQEHAIATAATTAEIVDRIAWLAALVVDTGIALRTVAATAI